MKTITLLKIYTDYLDIISSHVNMTRYEVMDHVKMIAGNCKTKKWRGILSGKMMAMKGIIQKTLIKN